MKEMMELVYAVTASIVYMLGFWLPKQIKEKYPQEINPKKIVRTVIWGVLVGAFVWYGGYEVSMTGIEGVAGKITGYGVLVIIVDKATLFVWRVLKRSSLSPYLSKSTEE